MNLPPEYEALLADTIRFIAPSREAEFTKFVLDLLRPIADPTLKDIEEILALARDRFAIRYPQ
jgi:hypothetical protein